ncbi:MAG: Rpn family recombination-promoting nuclease/putative transposase, partial [Lachnospiraceae bacterium]|nr:Rpn family recombination-promoting nuclease/putative transposase [Lachnospiraceae bacterium]
MIFAIANQANVHYAMPIRIMSEDVKEYDKQLRKIQKRHKDSKDLKTESEFLGNFSAEDKVPAVISIVVYYGKEPWDGARDLYEILDFTNIPEEMRLFINHYPIHVLEVRRFENTEWFQTDLREVFEVIQHAENKKMLKDFVESCGERLDDLAEDACEVIAAITKTPEFVFSKAKYRSEKGGIKMCQGMRDWLAEERALGHQEGHEEGRKEGHEEGRKEGHEEGRKEGHEEGRKEGHEEGR